MRGCLGGKEGQAWDDIRIEVEGYGQLDEGDVLDISTSNLNTDITWSPKLKKKQTKTSKLHLL